MTAAPAGEGPRKGPSLAAPVPLTAATRRLDTADCHGRRRGFSSNGKRSQNEEARLLVFWGSCQALGQGAALSRVPSTRMAWRTPSALVK